LALFLLSGLYAVRHFAITTDTTQLISEKVEWRRLESDFNTTFPQRAGLTLVVVDAPTPERADRAAADLAEQLKKATKVISLVRRPDAGDFFDRNGLLFLDVGEVKQRVDQLLAAQPFLGALAADPSLRGLANVMSLMAKGVREKETSFNAILGPLTKLAQAFEDIDAGRGGDFSWQDLITGGGGKLESRRRLILVQPIPDYSALQPGAASSAAIRSAARELNLTPENGVRVRLTGATPLADEEFATVADGAALNGVVTIFTVLLLLRFALRSFKIIAAVFVGLVVGFSMTMALGLMLVHALNLISVAFAALFVGIGVDFGLQFGVRYREERHILDNSAGALVAAGRNAGSPLALAAASVAAGFYSFLPTEYRGISELGMIAGTGMLIAFVTSVTLLPALISLARTPAEATSMGYRFLAPVDAFMARHRIAVLVVTAAVSIGGLPLLTRVRFDFNPLNLRSRAVESVATFLDLARDPATSPNAIEILAKSPAEATTLAENLRKLPEVDRALTLSSFVPADQDAKLEQIQDLAVLLGPSLYPSEIAAAPDDRQNVDALKSAAADLASAASASPEPGKDAAIRLAQSLTALAVAPPERRESATRQLFPGLARVLERARQSIMAEPVTLENLPPEIVDDWVAKDGRARVEVSAKGDSNDNAVLKKFVDAVRALAPNATGAPVSIQESGKTVVRAFFQAGALALGSIAILLFLALRSLRDVFLTLVPLILAGVVTLEICGLIDLPLNFANIIALPLLLGVGVAFKIYYVMAWRGGQTKLLQSSLTRAVFFSAMATATAFGSLYFSKHPGTSSMGKLMALSLVSTLAAAVLFQPALMGPPRAADAPPKPEGV
jgi:hopanoid biosynthesis associated RND transporter like protein HpnN